MTLRCFFQTKWKVCSWRHIVINLLSNEIGDSALALSEWGISISGLFQGQNLVQNIQVLAARKRRNVRKFLLLNHKIQIFYFLHSERAKAESPISLDNKFITIWRQEHTFHLVWKKPLTVIFGAGTIENVVYRGWKRSFFLNRNFTITNRYYPVNKYILYNIYLHCFRWKRS
jgi:hypothetical protein